MSRLKKILIYTFGSIFAMLALAYIIRETYNFVEKRKEKAVEYMLSDEEKALIRDGDIILRYGHGMVSDYIVNLFDEAYSISHCGIVHKTHEGIAVIHSESSSVLSKEGIQIQDFDEFTDAGHLNSVIVVRYNRTDSANLAVISKIAHRYLEKEIPFDYSFNCEDTTQMYCSEIIWHIFLDAFDDDIFADSEQQKPNFKQFKNFTDSSHFDVIINHQLRLDKEK